MVVHFDAFYFDLRRYTLSDRRHNSKLTSADCWKATGKESQVKSRSNSLPRTRRPTYGRQPGAGEKESAMRLRVVRGRMRDLIRLRRGLLRHGRLKDLDKVLLHLGRLKERYQQAWRYVKINLENLRLSWRWNRDELRLGPSAATEPICCAPI